LVGDDYAAGGFVPVAVFVEAAAGADSADDVVCCGRDVRGVLDDQAESVAELAGALFEEAESMGVPVNASAMTEAEFLGDIRGADPVEEIVFDGFAVGMFADDAADTMVVGACGALASTRLTLDGSRRRLRRAREAAIRFARFQCGWNLKLALELRVSDPFVLG
jgi:hypothetical protein